jgi:hypothetical protein
VEKDGFFLVSMFWLFMGQLDLLWRLIEVDVVVEFIGFYLYLIGLEL